MVAVERQSSIYFDIPADATIEIDAVGRVRSLPIVGSVRNTRVFPPQFGGDPVFYTTLETAARLQGRDAGFSMLALQLETPEKARLPWLDEKEAGTYYTERVEKQGFTVWYAETFKSDVHWFQSSMDGVLLILSVLGLLSLGLSGFLIANIMNATVAQQVWQIGVMKAVGATRARVLRVYLVTALFYGVFALVLSVPAGSAGRKRAGRAAAGLAQHPRRCDAHHSAGRHSAAGDGAGRAGGGGADPGLQRRAHPRRPAP